MLEIHSLKDYDKQREMTKRAFSLKGVRRLRGLCFMASHAMAAASLMGWYFYSRRFNASRESVEWDRAGCSRGALPGRTPLAGKYPSGYNEGSLNTLLLSSDFDAWLLHLADQKAKARILARLTSATFGNFGDCGPVGEGVSEMRIHVGPGYRVYYTRTGSTVYVLLTGGVKTSQTKDIAEAKKMARALKKAKR